MKTEISVLGFLFYWLLFETEVAILYSLLFFLRFILPFINSFLYSKAPIDSHVVIIPLTKLKSTHDSLTRFPVPIYNDKSQLQEFFLNFHLLRMYNFESNIKLAFSIQVFKSNIWEKMKYKQLIILTEILSTHVLCQRNK